MINTKLFFDQPIENYMKTYKNIQKIITGQGDDYTTGCLLDYNYFKKDYKMISKDLSKQQALDVNPKEIQQISFTGNLPKKLTVTQKLFKLKIKLILITIMINILLLKNLIS